MQEPKATKPKRGRPVNPKLSEDIIRAAGDMFSEMGLHATKMEHIAAKLKISKLTLYSRFQDKETLFAAVIQRKCREFIPEQRLIDTRGMNAQASLTDICLSLIKLLTSEDALGMERMLMALDNNERAKLTRMFYVEGPKRVIDLITEQLKKLSQQGILVVHDPIFAANAICSQRARRINQRCRYLYASANACRPCAYHC